MCVHPFLKLAQRLDGSGGVVEHHGAHGDRVRAREQHFHDVAAGADAAHAEDGHGDRAAYLIDHADRDREHRRAGQAAHDVGQDGTALFDVDAHAEQGVDERERVRAGRLGRTGDLGNVGHIRGQLDDERLFRLCLCRRNDLLDHFRLRAEGHAAAFYVRAGDVHLDEVDVRVRDLFDHALVFLDRVARDVGDDLRVVLTQEGDLLLDDAVDARVLQADAVENALRGLRDARRMIAEALGRGQTLDADAAELGQVEELAVFMTEAKRAGCGRDGVFQLHAAEIYS